jgi:hypothetical protein
MFEVPGSGITAVHVTEEYVRGESGPVYDKRSDIASADVNEEDDVNTSIRIKQ